MVWNARPTTETMAIGAVMVVLGELVRYWGVAYTGSLTRVRTVGAPEVVVAGPYAYVRNPLYVGNIMMYLGIGIMSNALIPWLPIAALAFFAFQYWMIVSLEEEFLAKEFGAAFSEFSKNVPRFIPRLVPYESPSQANQKPNWREAFRSERRTFQAIALVILVLCILWYRA
jgi:protein-S-isoprenylcysteine O-methyltransferase Ste14